MTTFEQYQDEVEKEILSGDFDYEICRIEDLMQCCFEYGQNSVQDLFKRWVAQDEERDICFYRVWPNGVVNVSDEFRNNYGYFDSLEDFQEWLEQELNEDEAS